MTPTTDSRGSTEALPVAPIVNNGRGEYAGGNVWIIEDIYREPKTIPHRTWNGRGVVGRLRR